MTGAVGERAVGEINFDHYVEQNRRALFRFACVVAGDPHLADDVVSEVLARLLPQWERVARMDQPHAYVRRSVLNEYLSWRRRSQRFAARADVAAEWMAVIPGPADAHAERDALLRRVRALPDRQRAAIVMRYFEDLTFAEIAVALGTGENAVRSNISRALRQLRIDMTSVDDDTGDPSRPQKTTKP